MLKHLPSSLAAMFLCASVQCAQYNGRVGTGIAQARIDFANNAVSGSLCVEESKLTLRRSVYSLRGNSNPGLIVGDVLSDNKVVGSFKASRMADKANDALAGDYIAWTGTIVINEVTKSFQLRGAKNYEELMSFDAKNYFKADDALMHDQLTVDVSMTNFDAAIALLEATKAVTNVAFRMGEPKFIYDHVLDDCSRSLYTHVILNLTVDEFALKSTYDKLVQSKLFRGVHTESSGGPPSQEIPIEKSLIGNSSSQISSFLELLVERYFRQLRNTGDACRKHDGHNILSALRAIPEGESDPIVISALETNKFWVRRYAISGLSRDLAFGLRDHWERYEIEVKLYPGYQLDNYSLEITMTNGAIAPFKETEKPPVERFKPIDDSRLNEFVQKFAACVSRYVADACPNNSDFWTTNAYCLRRQRQP